MSPVLDASVFIATLSPAEPHHAAALALYAARPATSPFLVPAIFRLEVLAALTRKGAPAELIDTADALVRGPVFCAIPMDTALLDEAARLARLTGLRAYDAVYVAVAARFRTPLVTLDRDMVRRIEAAGVGVEVWA